MLPLSERRPPGARRFALSAWLCALSLAVLAAVVLAVTPQSPATAATPGATAAPLATQVSNTPFKARENYHCTRIPALVTTTKGVLLAFAEGRTRLTTTGCHDVGDNDIVLKRSLDGGATWQDLQVVVGAA